MTIAAEKAARLDAAITIQREADFDVTGAVYGDLFARADATAFQDPRWLVPFYRDLAPAREAEAVFITGRGEDGTLLFVLPMTVRTVSGCRLLEAADLGVCDYCAPVVDPAFAEALAGDQSLSGRVAGALPAHDVLRIRNIREEHVDLWRLFLGEEPKRLGFCAHETDLGDDYAAWRETALTPSFTKYLNRRKKRFLKAGDVTLERLDDPATAADAIGALAALRDGRFDGDMIRHDAVRDFYATVAADGAGDGFALTYRLAFDGQPVSYVFGATTKDRFHYLLIGCDYETYGKHSPGLVMYDLIIEDWIASGGAVFDFTIGDEPFKADYGTRAVPIYGIEASRSVVGRLALAAREAGASLRRLRRSALRGGMRKTD